MQGTGRAARAAWDGTGAYSTGRGATAFSLEKMGWSIMHGNISVPRRGTISSAVQSGAQLPDHLASEDWFHNMAKAMFPKDAGLFLHCATGFDERNCYRYAAGDRKPSAFFLLALLHSNVGGPIHSYVMDGCRADWWRELSNARELCAKFKVEPR